MLNNIGRMEDYKFPNLTYFRANNEVGTGMSLICEELKNCLTLKTLN